jgi:hypothetical protein
MGRDGEGYCQSGLHGRLSLCPPRAVTARAIGFGRFPMTGPEKNVPTAILPAPACADFGPNGLRPAMVFTDTLPLNGILHYQAHASAPHQRHCWTPPPGKWPFGNPQLTDPDRRTTPTRGRAGIQQTIRRTPSEPTEAALTLRADFGDGRICDPIPRRKSSHPKHQPRNQSLARWAATRIATGARSGTKTSGSCGFSTAAAGGQIRHDTGFAHPRAERAGRTWAPTICIGDP